MESRAPQVNFTEKFKTYFDRSVAQQAAKPLADSAEIEFRISGSDDKPLEIFTFTKSQGRIQVNTGPARDPQVAFTLTPAAAEQILSDPSEDVGSIGVAILKLVVSPDANRRVSVSVKVGFLTLFNKGYFGVVTAGGGAFASFLASRGLNGMGAIKAALKKLKG